MAHGHRYRWARFADGLRAKVEAAAAEHCAAAAGGPFGGCFVGTAMNHRAAMYTEVVRRYTIVVVSRGGGVGGTFWRYF